MHCTKPNQNLKALSTRTQTQLKQIIIHTTRHTCEQNNEPACSSWLLPNWLCMFYAMPVPINLCQLKRVFCVCVRVYAYVQEWEKIDFQISICALFEPHHFVDSRWEKNTCTWKKWVTAQKRLSGQLFFRSQYDTFKASDLIGILSMIKHKIKTRPFHLNSTSSP